MGTQPRFISYAFVFSAFLMLGFWSGDRLSNVIQRFSAIGFKSISQFATNSPPLAAPIYPLPDAPEQDGIDELPYTQENFLFLIVDDLKNKQPALESAWLLISVDHTARWIFLPITGSGQETNLESNKLIQEFSLDRNHRPSSSFLQVIHSQQILWHHYLIIDSTMEAQIRSISGYPVLPSDQNYRNLQAALHQDFLVSLCQGLSNQPFMLSSLNTDFSDHILSDADLDRVFANWQMHILENGRLNCEFPTLQN